MYTVTRSTYHYQNCSQPSGVWLRRITHVKLTEEDLVWRNVPVVVSGAIRVQLSGSWMWLYIVGACGTAKGTHYVRERPVRLHKLLTEKPRSSSTSAFMVFLGSTSSPLFFLLHCNPVTLVSASTPVICVLPWRHHSHTSHIFVNVWMLVVLKPYIWFLFIT